MTDKQIIIDGEQCQYLRNTGLCRLIYTFTEKSYDCSMCKDTPNCYYKQLKRLEKLLPDINGKFYKAVDALKAKEQECERLEKENYELTEEVSIDRALFAEIDQLKAEVKSKTEYIQEQRDIINQYSKEIEMYKKCQGKRASKREEELKAENEKLDTKNKRLVAELANPVFDSFEELDKFKQTLTEIKEIAEFGFRPYKVCGEHNNCCDVLNEILQKISECEAGNG